MVKNVLFRLLPRYAGPTQMLTGAIYRAVAYERSDT